MKALGWRWLGTLVLIPLAVYVVALGDSVDFAHQFDTVAAADGGRLSDVAAIHRGILVDLLFIASFALLALPARVSRRQNWLPPYRRERWYGRLGWLMILLAAALDMIEDLILWFVRTDSALGWLWLLATIGWIKLLAYFVALFVVYVSLIGPSFGIPVAAGADWLYSRLELFSKTPQLQETTATDVYPPARATMQLPGATEPKQARKALPVAPDGDAICLSGGGIRAASVALGALRRMDEPAEAGVPSLFRSAKWLCSVSGGGYIAGGWRISRQAPTTSTPPVSDTADGLFATTTAWFRRVRSRRHYLANSVGGLLGAGLAALARILLVLGAVIGSAVLAGWIMGLFVGWDAVVAGAGTGRIVTLSKETITPFIAIRLWLPGAALAALALVAELVTLAVPSWRVSRSSADPPHRPLSMVTVSLAGIAAVLLLVLVGVPLLVGLGPSVVVWILDQLAPGAKPPTRSGSTLTLLLSVLSGLGVAAAIVGLATKRLQRTWQRLGGFVLALGLSVVAVVVARAGASGHRLWWGGVTVHRPDGGGAVVPTLVVVAAAAVFVVSQFDTHRITLAGLYRKRLAQTFASRSVAGSQAQPIDYGHELAWPALVGQPGPELVISSTVHSSTYTVSGVKGYGLTFDPRHVVLYDGSGPAGRQVPIADFPSGSWYQGFPRTWSVSRAMAISGAAIASAMGRQNLGTTNALVAALNVRLGMWLPNPLQLNYFREAVHTYDKPRVGLTYLAKEIFGRYDVLKDPFIYVADGSHRENLGLVDILRQRPARIFAVDASGDRPTTFKTAQEAIDLAAVELGIKIAMHWAPIITAADPPGSPLPLLPACCAARATVTYPDGATAQLFYGRYQVSSCAPVEIRAFAARNPKFPYYSTADQFLTEAEFDHLVALGEHVATELCLLASGGRCASIAT